MGCTHTVLFSGKSEVHIKLEVHITLEVYISKLLLVSFRRGIPRDSTR